MKAKNSFGWPKGVYRTLDYPEAPVYGFLNAAASRQPDTVAIRFSGTEITYRELLESGAPIRQRVEGAGGKKGRPGGHPSAELPAVCHRLLCAP